MLEFCYFYAICCVVSENHILLSVFKVISVLQINGKKIFQTVVIVVESTFRGDKYQRKPQFERINTLLPNKP